MVSDSDGPTDQKRLGQVSQLAAVVLSNPAEALKVRVGKVGGLGHADLRIGLGHQPFIGGDIRAPFQQL